MNKGPFKKLVVSGDSMVEGGAFLEDSRHRWPDILADLFDAVQYLPLTYKNDGIHATVVSPVSPAYSASAKPSLAERYKKSVIDESPDLWVVAFGLNDMRSGMQPETFMNELNHVVEDVNLRCNCVTVICNLYHMTGWDWYPPFDKGNQLLAEKYNAILRKYVAGSEYIYADISAAMNRTDWLIHNDGCHSNDAGNFIIANEVFRTILINCEGVVLALNKRHEETQWSKSARALRFADSSPDNKNNPSL